MLFAEGKPLGERGLIYLKAQVAGMCGVDKVSYDDRVAWVESQLDKIFDSADHPLEVRNPVLSRVSRPRVDAEHRGKAGGKSRTSHGNASPPVSNSLTPFAHPILRNTSAACRSNSMAPVTVYSTMPPSVAILAPPHRFHSTLDPYLAMFTRR